jgi:hypothetical protein
VVVVQSERVKDNSCKSKKFHGGSLLLRGLAVG